MIKEWQGNSARDPERAVHLGLARVNGCIRNLGVSLKCRIPPFSLSSRCKIVAGYGRRTRRPAVSVAQDFRKVKSATRAPWIPLSLRRCGRPPALPEPENETRNIIQIWKNEYSLVENLNFFRDFSRNISTSF